MSRKSALHEAGVCAFFLALAVLLTWPLAAHLDTAVADLGDPLINTWILDWVCHALTHEPLSLFDAPIFHPALKPLAYSENLVAIAILVLPFHLVGLAPIAVYNIALLLGFTLSGYGAFVLARMVSRSTIGALAGGIFFAFCTYKFDHLAHLQIVFSAGVPLALAALLAYWRRPALRSGACVAAAWVLLGLTNIYFLLFVTVTAVITIAVLERRPPRAYLGLALAFAAAAIVLLPFLLPYRTVSRHYRLVREAQEVQTHSATWTNWLVPSSTSRLYGDVPEERLFAPEKQLFPGLAILACASLALFGRRRIVDALIVLLLALAWASTVRDVFDVRVFGHVILSTSGPDIPLILVLVLLLFRKWERPQLDREGGVAALWIAIGILGSFGLNAFFYTFLFRRFETFAALRVPARFAIIAYAGLAVWGAIGIARLPRKKLVAAIVIALVTIDVWPRVRWELAPAGVAPVYRWLAKERIGPVLELPSWGDGLEYEYLLGATAHHVPIVNGVSGFAPPEAWKVRDAEQRDAYDELLAHVERWNVKLVVVHGDAIPPDRHAALAQWLRRSVDRGRLGFVRRFDSNIAGDYVFAIPRNLPDWRRLRLPDAPDGAGQLLDHRLARFLARQTTYSDSIALAVEQPQAWSHVQGALQVRGWALSPHGIRRATVLLDAGRVRIPATLAARDDVKQQYPWAYMTPTPGFALTIPARPDGVPRETDVQVEIEDHRGRVRRSRDLLLTWQ